MLRIFLKYRLWAGLQTKIANKDSFAGMNEFDRPRRLSGADGILPPFRETILE
jgi:hypothetical protein